MLRAILVSYERVLVDGESLDRRLWSQILGRPIAQSEWTARGAGREPREALMALLGNELVQPEAIRGLLGDRARRLVDAASEGRLISESAAEFVRQAARRAPVGLCHRAPGVEVVAALKGSGIFDRFTALSPGGFGSGLSAINADLERLRREPVSPRGTLALAGSRDGVAEARSLGMRVVAVGERVGGADHQAPGLGTVDLDQLAGSLF